MTTQMPIGSPKLPDITSKADLAVFGLGYAVGYALYVVVFRLSTPSPTTVALVVAIAALAFKSGIQAWQEREPPPRSDHEIQENLRNRLFAFEELFSEGTQIHKTGRVTQLALDATVHLETRWVPNPYYDPRGTESGGELRDTGPPYFQIEDTEDLRQRVLVLHALWKAGIVTDAYTEARLDELSDFCSRKALLREGYSEAVQEAEDSHFGSHLVKLMYNKGVSRADLARRTGLSMNRIADIERNPDPEWSMVHTVAEALDVDFTEFLPRSTPSGE